MDKGAYVNLVTTEDYEEEFDGLWAGSFIHNVILKDGFYTGIWASQMGIYRVSVPHEICKVKEDK